MSWPEYKVKEMRKEQLEAAKKRGLNPKAAADFVDELVKKIYHDEK